LGANRPWGETTSGRIVQGANRPVGKTSRERIVQGAKRPVGEMCSGRNDRIVQRAKHPAFLQRSNSIFGSLNVM